MRAQNSGDGGQFLNFRQPERGVTASRARSGINVGPGVNQGLNCCWLIFVDGMHQRSPAINAATLIDIGARSHQFGDLGGIPGTRRHAKRGYGDSGIASVAQKRDKKKHG
jgi:hypothetical protein